MRLMEEVFFSSTFGGETLSLAAALATMRKLEREPVIETLYRQGRKVLHGLQARIESLDATDFLAVSGNPTWSFLLIRDTARYSEWQILTLLMQEMLAHGILTFGSHNMSYSHSDDDLERLFAAYDRTLPRLVEAVRDGTLESMLTCQPLEPLFKVR
jgi:glutamate-1-semialdehyde 2,1-aminomutase